MENNKQRNMFDVDPSLSAIASTAVEFGIETANYYRTMGYMAVSTYLDCFGGGLKGPSDVSKFLKAEIAPDSLDKRPKEAIWEDERAVLYKYKTPETLSPGCEHKDIPLVTTFALMNSGSIFGKDLIPHMLDSGYDVYRPDWKKPHRGDNNPGLAEYFVDTLPDVLEQAKKSSSSKEVSLLGWCQGGYGATILTALQKEIAARAGYPNGDLGIRNLILLTTPLSVSEKEKTCGGFAEMINDPSFDAEALVEANGGVIPGWTIDAASKGLKPYETYFENHFNLWEHVQKGDDTRVEKWKGMNGWLSDTRNISGPFYVDFVNGLYRDDKLAKGELVIRDMPPVNLKDIDASVLTIIANQDHIVPKNQIKDALHLFGSKDHTVIEKDGGHISVVSRGTCKQIEEWLAQRSDHDQQYKLAV